MKKNVYLKDRRKAVLLYVCGAIAILAAAAMIAFLVFTLRLRAEYRDTCIEINEAILNSRGTSARTISKGGQSCPLDDRAADYYDMFLLDGKTVVYNRKSYEPDGSCLILSFPGSRLILKDIDAGIRIGVRWETEEGARCYSVACGTYTFMQLESYFKNMVRHAEAAA